MYYEALKPVCFLRFIWISSISYHMFFLHNMKQIEREKPHLFFFFRKCDCKTCQSFCLWFVVKLEDVFLPVQKASPFYRLVMD